MSYTLKKQADGSSVLTKNGKNCVCPYKDSAIKELQNPEFKGADITPSQPVSFIKFIGQPCSDVCPLFESNETKTFVQLHCGGLRQIQIDESKTEAN